MAHIGSAEDKAVRKAAAETEPAWTGCGSEVGTEIWRIEKFKVVPWPKEEYGNFFSGDSYIVLKTSKDADSDKLLFDIHFWLGTETSQDEKGTAAYKTVELDALKDDVPVQHREVQGHESQEFQKMFDEIHYMDGGIESGFNHVVEGAYVPQLFQIKKLKKTIKCTMVPCTRASLNHSDCFVLDLGKRIYSWQGDTASPFEKAKCATVAANMSSKRAGKANHIKDQDDDFWAALGGEGEIAAEGGESVMDDIGEGILFKLSDETGSLKVNEVARGDLKRAMLSSEDVFLVDTGLEIFVWVGLASSDKEQMNAFQTADNYLSDSGRPMHTPVHLYREGQVIKNEIWQTIFDF